MPLGASGSQSYLAWVSEATWGTTPANPTMRVIPFSSESLNSSIGLVENDAIRSDRMYESPGPGVINASGDINVVWNAQALGFFVTKTLGGSVSTSGTGPYVHTIEQRTSGDMPSITIEKGFTDIGQYFVYTGCRINRATFEIAPEQNVRGVINVEARNEAPPTGTPLNATLTSLGGEPLNSFSGTLSEGGVALALVESASITLENNLTPRITILHTDARMRADIGAGRLRVSGQINVVFANATLYNKYRNFTQSSMVIRMADTGGLYIEFDIKALRYGGNAPAISGEGPVSLVMPFTAFRDTTSGKQIVGVVRNNLNNASFDV